MKEREREREREREGGKEGERERHQPNLPRVRILSLCGVLLSSLGYQ